MNKELFIKTMAEIRKLQRHERNIDAAMKELDSDFGGFSLGNAIMLSIELLQYAMNDKYEWITYYIYETEWGTNECAESVTDFDGSKIPFNTFENVYDLIVSEQDNVIETSKHIIMLQKLVDRLSNYINDDDFKREIDIYFKEKNK